MVEAAGGLGGSLETALGGALGIGGDLSAALNGALESALSVGGSLGTELAGNIGGDLTLRSAVPSNPCSPQAVRSVRISVPHWEERSRAESAEVSTSTA